MAQISNRRVGKVLAACERNGYLINPGSWPTVPAIGVVATGQLPKWKRSGECHQIIASKGCVL